MLKYPNHNKRWTSEEDNKLRSFIKIQKCIYKISTIFKRKPSAIRGRILKFEEEDFDDK